MVRQADNVETRFVGYAGVSQYLAHLVDAGLQPDAEEDVVRGSHKTIQSAFPLQHSAQHDPVGQLSSRTLRVSMCCWKATALPPFMVHTWTISTAAGSPELLCFHLQLPSATTVSPSATNCSGTTASHRRFPRAA